jgi:hypothetical protein
MSHLYSISAHTLLNKLKVNTATTALILPAYSGKVANNSGTYTATFMYPKREKKVGVRSSEQDGLPLAGWLTCMDYK